MKEITLNGDRYIVPDDASYYRLSDQNSKFEFYKLHQNPDMVMVLSTEDTTQDGMTLKWSQYLMESPHEFLKDGRVHHITPNMLKEPAHSDKVGFVEVKPEGKKVPNERFWYRLLKTDEETKKQFWRSVKPHRATTLKNWFLWTGTVWEKNLHGSSLQTKGELVEMTKEQLHNDKDFKHTPQSWEEHPVHREDQKKCPVHMCPPAIIAGVANTLLASSEKKGREKWNWRENQIDLMGYLGKILRHIHAVIDKDDPEDIDLETQTHHLECAAANLAIILDARKHKTLVDNRPMSSKNIS